MARTYWWMSSDHAVVEWRLEGQRHGGDPSSALPATVLIENPLKVTTREREQMVEAGRSAGVRTHCSGNHASAWQ